MTKRCLTCLACSQPRHEIEADMYVYYGDWMIASIKRVLEDQAVFDSSHPRHELSHQELVFFFSYPLLVTVCRMYLSWYYSKSFCEFCSD